MNSELKKNESMAAGKKYLFLIFIFFKTINTFACNCEGTGSVEVSVKAADVVFSGTVISKTVTTNYDSLGIIITGDTNKTTIEWSDLPVAVVKIKVEKMYKGQTVSDTLTILTPSMGSTCGFRFQLGEKYIVYATLFEKLPVLDSLKRRSFDQKTWWTYQCTRTQKWNEAEENEILKKGN